MRDVRFEIVMNVDFWISFEGGDFRAFGDTIAAFGEICSVVVLNTHLTLPPKRLPFPKISLESVHYGSPLAIVATLRNVSDAAIELLNSMLSRLLYYDEEREKRILANGSVDRDIRRKDFETAREMVAFLLEAKTAFSLRDIARLAQAVHIIARQGSLVSHRIGPVNGGAAVVVEENKDT